MIAVLASAMLSSRMAISQQLMDSRLVRNELHTNAGGDISLDAAVAMVQKKFHAKAVKADPVNESGRRVYYIRLLSAEGRVWQVRVDAQTGQVN
jgi:uncharacterized membrane protein YkoI